MRLTILSRVTYHVSSHKDWAILGLFSCLTVIMLYPLSLNLSGMVPEPTDPLLNAWRMQWNARAFLGGPAGLANLFNTNIFYPFPLTLAYSEHFLIIAAQALPFLLLAQSHLFGMNLSVLVTFVLSGYGMYLLVTAWTTNRWAGLVAGLLFAFSPHRFGQLNHLELLVTQWMPLALLALHWTLTRPGWRYPALFVIFFNLQALSGFHFTLNLAIACALLALVYTLTRRVYWRGGLWLAAVISVGGTLLLNWPVWRMYLRFSDVMGAIRTPGEVRIYSAVLTDYLTTIPHNLLYGWTFGRWQLADHQFQPLMPVGAVGLLLALVGVTLLTGRQPQTPKPAHRLSPPGGNLSVLIFLVTLTLLGLLLSFGINENALGPALAPLLKYSPYVWLYNNVAAFQGIRVPGRFGILVVIGLVGLAGRGVRQLTITKLKTQNLKLVVPIIALILLESWSAPLVGPQFPAGPNIPPIYHWLRTETPPEAVVLELPFRGASEFLYEYYSSHHWRRLANGGTGFTPPIYKALRQWFNAFPDPRSVDVVQQLGIDIVILHPDSYSPDEWQRVMADLPRYLPAIEELYQIGDALALRMSNPVCRPQADAVQVGITPAELDGLPTAVSVRYHNSGPAAFVSNVQQPSQLTLTGGTGKNFTEPLVVPAGESQAVIVPLPAGQLTSLSGAQLAALNRSVTPADVPLNSPPQNIEAAWQPLALHYADGPELAAYSLTPAAPSACSLLTVALQWTNGRPNDSVTLQLLDPFGRVVAESNSQPFHRTPQLDAHSLPLVGPLPAGQYGLRVYVYAADGSERQPITAEGVTIPTQQIPPLPVVVHPAPRALPPNNALAGPVTLANAVTLMGASLPRSPASPGDWLRFSLVWQIDGPVEKELTVFTQLIGPDGRVWGQRDNQPGGGWYKMPLWIPGRPVVDDYAFQIDPQAPPGVYRLVAGLYHSDTQQRLLLPTGADFVELGPITVSANGQ